MAHCGDDGDIQADEYRAPAQKSVQDIIMADAEDESLAKYKATLLGTNGASVVIDGSNPKHVLVQSLTLISDGRQDVTMQLTDDALQDIANKTFVIKEGATYRLRVDFYVQREIVAGLKYVQKVARHGVPVDKDEHMVGSYPPKEDMHSFTTPPDEAPSGMLHRGTYKVKSLFTDDDKNEWLKWEWTLEIKKEWE